MKNEAAEKELIKEADERITTFGLPTISVLGFTTGALVILTPFEGDTTKKTAAEAYKRYVYASEKINTSFSRLTMYTTLAVFLAFVVMAGNIYASWSLFTPAQAAANILSLFFVLFVYFVAVVTTSKLASLRLMFFFERISYSMLKRSLFRRVVGDKEVTLNLDDVKTILYENDAAFAQNIADKGSDDESN